MLDEVPLRPGEPVESALAGVDVVVSVVCTGVPLMVSIVVTVFTTGVAVVCWVVLSAVVLPFLFVVVGSVVCALSFVVDVGCCGWVVWACASVVELVCSEVVDDVVVG